MNTDKNISSDKAGRIWTWCAVALTILSYIILLLWNGVAAMTVSAFGVVAGFIALFRTSGALRRLAVAAVIASAVLLVVVGAFVMVINLGLR